MGNQLTRHQMATGHSDSIYIVRIGHSDSGDPDDQEPKRRNHMEKVTSEIHSYMMRGFA